MKPLTLYPADPVRYDCPAERQAVSLTALWYLDTDQGAEGQVSPMCTKVICSQAGTCESLANGRCPLTVGYGEVMNILGVRVLHNLVSPIAQANGQLVAVSKFHPAYPIWFGRTTVLSSRNGVGA